MIPQIKAKFRVRKGVPFAVERLTGVQYRCRKCNQVFINKNDFEKHLIKEINTANKSYVNQKCPKIHDVILTNVYYNEDVHDALSSVNVKVFKSGDKYDGRLKKRINKT